MAKITKACKGVSYPKSSSVSKRLGSPSKAKKGITMKKAQNGTGKQTERGFKVGGGWDGTLATRAYADTSGYAAGKKRFPSTLHVDNVRTGEKDIFKPKSGTVGRGAIRRALKKSKTGTSLGMKSVKAGYDKNPGVTRADIIVAAKKEAKSGTKMKKALLGIGIGKEERMARRAERQGNRQMRRSERQSMRMSRDNANPYRRGCKGGNCASRNIGTRIVGFKKGGKMKKCAYGCK